VLGTPLPQAQLDGEAAQKRLDLANYGRSQTYCRRSRAIIGYGARPPSGIPGRSLLVWTVAYLDRYRKILVVRLSRHAIHRLTEFRPRVWYPKAGTMEGYTVVGGKPKVAGERATERGFGMRTLHTDSRCMFVHGNHARLKLFAG
jgi:hypothetical protein